MATVKIQVTLDERLVALLGNDRSGNIRDAIIHLFNVDRTTLTPNITQYAGGAKPLGKPTPTVAPKVTNHQPVVIKVINEYDWRTCRERLLAKHGMTDDQADEFMLGKYRLYDPERDVFAEDPDE